jgi:hypothetical protein
MPWGAVAGAVVGAVASSNAASTAADAQIQAAQMGINQQNQALSQEAALSQPWRDAGQIALSNLTAGTQPGGAYNQQFTPANFQNTPAYQFQMAQGQQQLQQQEAAQGLNMSGAQVQGLSAYNQGLAAQQYQQQYANFMNNQQQQFANQNTLSTQGQAAAAGQAANVGAAANNITNLTTTSMTNAANAQAQGQLGMSQAIQGGVNSYMQNQQFQQYLDAINPNATPTTPTTSLGTGFQNLNWYN